MLPCFFPIILAQLQRQGHVFEGMQSNSSLFWRKFEADYALTQ